MSKAKIEQLLTAYSNAAFDCGAYDQTDKAGYEKVLAKWLSLGSQLNAELVALLEPHLVGEWLPIESGPKADAQREPELLPCPFCGKQPECVAVEDADPFRARCGTIGCPVDMGMIRPEVWNTRSRLTVADWKEKYEEEKAIVDRVWRALGIETYEQARGLAIDEIVAELRCARPTVEAAEIRYAVKFVDHIQGSNCAEWQCLKCGSKWVSPANLLCPACKDNIIAARDAAPTPPEDSRDEATGG